MIVAHIGQAAYYFATQQWVRSIEWAQRGIALGDRHGIIAWSVHRLLAIVAEAAWYEEQYELTEAAGRRLRVEAPRLGHGLGVLYAEAAEVFLAHRRAPTPETVPALLGIAERAESVPYVSHAARLRRFAAKIMLATGDTAGAEREYRLAHETFRRLGVEFELRLTREQMREQGWRPPSRLNGARGVLTPRESKIALLAARGLTNKEIGTALDISWRTVSRHLATIYTKLGVDSRLGLAEAVKRRAEG